MTIILQSTLRKEYLFIDFFRIDPTKTYNFNAPTLVTPASHKIVAKMRYSMSKDTAFNGETMFAPWRSQNPLRITGSVSHYSHHTRQNEELLVKVSGSSPLFTFHVISTRFSKHEMYRLQGFHSIRTKRLKKQKKKRTLWI